ncbi:MAG: hypothetical protein KKH52_04040, partial [Nanoarchaeota archaeon]|nr:hypothetical protein [Nanoarchaeota archaeon]
LNHQKKTEQNRYTRKRLLHRAARIKVKIELLQEKIALKKKPWFGSYEESLRKAQNEAAEIQASLQSIKA